MNDPQISIWVDEKTKEASYRLIPQTLTPAQYGLIIGGLIAHLVRLFMQSNPGTSEVEILEAIQKGIDASDESRSDYVVAGKPH